jgi:hypothetical protein
MPEIDSNRMDIMDRIKTGRASDDLDSLSSFLSCPSLLISPILVVLVVL